MDVAVDQIPRFKPFHECEEGFEAPVAPVSPVMDPLGRGVGQQDVKKAQGYLAAGNGGKADKVLKSAERRVMSLYTGLNSPIFWVKQNAWLALKNYSAAGKSNAVKQYLGQARANLKKATAGMSTSGKKEAGELSQEIAGLERKLAGEETVAMSELQAVWEKSRALVERSAAYISSDLAEGETTLRGDYNLIEARLHVAYAETYQVTTLEPEKATKELGMAYSYLQKAAANKFAGPSDRMMIGEAEKILLRLKASPEKNNAVVRDRYFTIKMILDDLIY